MLYLPAPRSFFCRLFFLDHLQKFILQILIFAVKDVTSLLKLDNSGLSFAKVLSTLLQRTLELVTKLFTSLGKEKKNIRSKCSFESRFSPQKLDCFVCITLPISCGFYKLLWKLTLHKQWILFLNLADYWKPPFSVLWGSEMHAQNNLVRCRSLGHFELPQASVSKRGLVQKCFFFLFR